MRDYLRVLETTGTGDWSRWLFISAFGLIGPIAFQAPKALITVVLPMATLSLLWWTWRTRRLRAAVFFSRGWALWLFVAVTLASAAWSVDPEASVSRSLRLVGEVLLGMGLLAYVGEVETSWRRPALLAAALGLGLAAVLAVIDMASGFVIADWLGRTTDDIRFVEEPRLYYSWGAVLVALLLPPSVVVLARTVGRATAVLLALLGTGAVLALASLTAKVALVAAIATGICVFVWGGSRWILGAAMLAVLVALPVALPAPHSAICKAFEVGSSAAHRLMIYNAADAQIAKRPLLGWGMNTSSEVLRLRQLERWPTCAAGRVYLERAIESPRHPHNLPLQIRLELGLPGIAAAALLLLVVFRTISRPSLDRATSAAAWGTTAAVVVGSLFGFGIWQGWLIASYVLAAAVVRMLQRSDIGAVERAGTGESGCNRA